MSAAGEGKNRGGGGGLFTVMRVYCTRACSLVGLLVPMRARPCYQLRAFEFPVHIPGHNKPGFFLHPPRAQVLSFCAYDGLPCLPSFLPSPCRCLSSRAIIDLSNPLNLPLDFLIRMQSSVSLYFNLSEALLPPSDR